MTLAHDRKLSKLVHLLTPELSEDLLQKVLDIVNFVECVHCDGTGDTSWMYDHSDSGVCIRCKGTGEKHEWVDGPTILPVLVPVSSKKK